MNILKGNMENLELIGILLTKVLVTASFEPLYNIPYFTDQKEEKRRQKEKKELFLVLHTLFQH